MSTLRTTTNHSRFIQFKGQNCGVNPKYPLAFVRYLDNGGLAEISAYAITDGVYSLTEGIGKPSFVAIKEYTKPGEHYMPQVIEAHMTLLKLQIAHPNLMQVLDVDPESKLVMLEFFPPPWASLHSIIEKRNQKVSPFNVRAARVLLSQIAKGLQKMHENGIVHRDVKPSNIMLYLAEPNSSAISTPLIPPEARVKLGDFDLAIEENKLVPTATFSGTDIYVAPERFTKSPQDRRLDIYSLGILAYELFLPTGKFSDIFMRESANELFADKVNGKFIAPNMNELVPGLGADLSKLLAAMISFSSNDRPNMNEIIDTLKKA